MKKLRIVSVSLLMGILLFALTACGGASGAVSGFVKAVKKLDFEKAAEYCVDGDLVEAMGETSTEGLGEGEDWEAFGEKMNKKVFGKFSYKVTETVENEEEKTATVKISYEAVDMLKLSLSIAAELGAEALDPDLEKYEAAFDAAWEDVKTVEDTMEIALKQNDEGEWEIVSGVAVLTAIVTAGMNDLI